MAVKYNKITGSDSVKYATKIDRRSKSQQHYEDINGDTEAIKTKLAAVETKIDNITTDVATIKTNTTPSESGTE